VYSRPCVSKEANVRAQLCTVAGHDSRARITYLSLLSSLSLRSRQAKVSRDLGCTGRSHAGCSISSEFPVAAFNHWQFGIIACNIMVRFELPLGERSHLCL
jgi:hypothetical protein